MARGGRRTPNGRTPQVSGPGAASRRTDNQPISVPNVGDSTDLRHGDRQQLEASQQVAGIPRSRAPQIPGSASSPTSPGGPSGGGASVIPPEFWDRPSTRPDEAVTTGLDFGPGDGSSAISAQPDPEDDKMFVLHIMSGPPFYSEAAANKLRRMMEERAPTPPPSEMGMEPMMEEEMAPVDVDTEPELSASADFDEEEDLATEEEVAVEGEETEPELSVETPEAAASIPEEAI